MQGLGGLGVGGGGGGHLQFECLQLLSVLLGFDLQCPILCNFYTNTYSVFAQHCNVQLFQCNYSDDHRADTQ